MSTPVLEEHPRYKPVVSYAAAHYRVRRAYGKASEHTCVQCGGPAQQWAYDHIDPDELWGFWCHTEMAYSLNPEHYQAMCAPCHAAFDGKTS